MGEPQPDPSPFVSWSSQWLDGVGNLGRTFLPPQLCPPRTPPLPESPLRLAQGPPGTFPGAPACSKNVAEGPPPRCIRGWGMMLSPTYKQRNEDFRRIFKGLPESERLLVDYSCALQRDILLQGRLYLSENWLCFYSNIFRWETAISVPLREVKCLKKEKMAKLIPNAIQVCTAADKHFFTSFGARDRCFMLIFRLWQNALLEKTLSPRELWHIVHQGYGAELGLTSEDDDYVSPLPPRVGPVGAGGGSRGGWGREGARPGEVSGPCWAPLTFPSPQLAEDPEENVDSQADTASNCTVTPGLEPSKAAVLGGPPLPALGDLLPHEDLPTDTSNSSSSSSSTQDEAEVDAFSDLPGRLLLNCVYCLGAERLQQMLFSDSPFMQSFLGQRKFTDVTLTSWSGKSKCHQSRVLSYTIPLSNPLGPKAAAVVETQTLFRASPDSGACVVDSEVITQGIPYQDYFYTAHRYCISTLATGTARLRVSSEIRYRKQPWNLVRALIEKNTWSGVEEYFQHLGTGYLAPGTGDSHTCNWGVGPELRGSLPGSGRGWGVAVRAGGWEPGCMGSVPCTQGCVLGTLGDPYQHQACGRALPAPHPPSPPSLLVLVVLNVMLLYRLWALEHTARAFQAWQASALARGKLPRTAGEWAEVLELQRRFHGAEVQKWRRILEASVELLDEMKVSLEKLHQGIMMAEPPPEPGEADAIS
uniref:GRAM domain containing 1A n=1 Tax=Terrapene triunguis TaxID=2587831 RepID=A0A674IGC7_9SAUR